jgi:hypothetical protein
MSNLVSLHGVLLARTRRYMRSLGLLARVRLLLFLWVFSLPNTPFADIAKVGNKVIDFYKTKGGEVISPLLKAL